jgi:hypothetical protein
MTSPPACQQAHAFDASTKPGDPMSGQPARGHSGPPFAPATERPRLMARSRNAGARRSRTVSSGSLRSPRRGATRRQFVAAVDAWACADPRQGRQSSSRAANARARLGLDPLVLAKLLGTLTVTAVAAGDDQASRRSRRRAPGRLSLTLPGKSAAGPSDHTSEPARRSPARAWNRAETPPPVSEPAPIGQDTREKHRSVRLSP